MSLFILRLSRSSTKHHPTCLPQLTVCLETGETIIISDLNGKTQFFNLFLSILAANLIFMLLFVPAV